MGLQKLMHNYAEYNRWANKTLADWLRQKPQELLAMEIPSSYPSLIKTMGHLADTEKFWLGILKGNAQQQWEEYAVEGPEVMEFLLECSEALRIHIMSFTENQLLAPCVIDVHWIKGEMPAYEFIQHCINHASYHRGQIITIARNLGITDPPMTDYNYYNMVIKKR